MLGRENDSAQKGNEYESDPSGTTWRARSIEARGHCSHRGTRSGAGGGACGGGGSEFHGRGTAARELSAPGAVHSGRGRSGGGGVGGAGRQQREAIGSRSVHG